MMQWTRVSEYAGEGRGRVASTFEFVRRQPNWVARFALLTFFIVIGLPILLLVLFALIAATVVFGVLARINVLLARGRGFGGMVRRSDGRENVRVIRHGAER